MFANWCATFRRTPRIDYSAIRRLDLQPGDVLILRCEQELPQAQIAALKDSMEPILQELGIRGIVLDPSFRIEVLGAYAAPQQEGKDTKQSNSSRDQNPNKDRVAVKTKPRKGGIDRPA